MRLILVLNLLLMKFTEVQLLKRQFLFFLFTGFCNTLLTYCVYLIAILFVDYRIAFTVSYVFGILISYFLNSIFVFNMHLNTINFKRYLIVYMSQYLFGVLLLYCFVTIVNINKKFAPWGVIFINIPLTFMLMRMIFKDRYAHQSM